MRTLAQQPRCGGSMPPTFNSLLFAHALQQSVKARLLLSVGCRYCLLIATHANHNEALNNRSNEHRHCFIGAACAFVEATQQRLFSPHCRACWIVRRPGPCTCHEEPRRARVCLGNNQNQMTRTAKICTQPLLLSSCHINEM